MLECAAVAQIVESQDIVRRAEFPASANQSLTDKDKETRRMCSV
jgi:hypothetical protein